MALELVAIEKSFGGVRALEGAALSARRGELLGLCGENGAGKSTLLKILAGIHPRATYGGSTKVFGVEQRFESTRDAERAGIAIVHQELALVPELSVAANLALGHEPTHALGLLDDEAIELSARELLARFGVEDDVDPRVPIGTLGIGLQQVVEIVRALSRSAKILVLDEPTAALTAREADRLMTWLRDLRAKGTTCLYVSHRIDEVFALCDRVTVLRDGKTVGTVEIASTTPDEVVTMMVGRSIAKSRVAAASHADSSAAPRLEVKGLSVPQAAPRREEEGARRHAIGDVSFVAKRGEVVAIAGAMGSGRTALLSALFGCARHGFTGEVRVDGAEVALPSPRAAIAAGLALVPEDRKGSGLVLGLPAMENLALAPRGPVERILARLGFVDDEADELAARERIAELRIRGDAASEVSTFSGGNQQKVVIGKWLASPPRVLLLDEPTRGVDVGAREEIYGILERLTAKGTTIVLASSDLAEVLRLADRILVLRHGAVVAELEAAAASEAEIVALTTGAAA
ncbi:MAG: sugar ABC transporter ATP-binding protein [Deltaproteobacteria bacterium]|nr:sugar ABC transporter ATP-binding protein [Deltaproteobacteria bacterium]